ncbi:MAG: PAS domain S-box protein [Vicinamibacterales bacterium]
MSAQGGRPRRSLTDAGTRTLFKSLPATVWMTDDQLVLRYVQGRLMETLHLDPATLIGRSLPVILLDGRQDHPFIEAHRTALAGHAASIRIEWGGNLYHASLAPIRDANDRVIGCAGVQQRIGWKPDDDVVLRESDIRLQRILDENLIGIVFGNADGLITDANDAFLRLVGRTRDDLGALSWTALTPVEAHARQVAAIEEVTATGRCAPFETEILRADGRRIPVIVGGARLSASRREGVAFVLDVSDHQRAIARLQGELACVDALEDAPSPDAAAAGVVANLREGLGWRAAAVWLRHGPTLDRVATDGVASGTTDLDALGRRAARADRPVWVERAATFAAPLAAAGRRFGALVLIADPARETTRDDVDTARRVAARLSRHLARRGDSR